MHILKLYIRMDGIYMHFLSNFLQLFYLQSVIIIIIKIIILIKIIMYNYNDIDFKIAQ